MELGDLEGILVAAKHAVIACQNDSDLAHRRINQPSCRRTAVTHSVQNPTRAVEADVSSNFECVLQQAKNT